MLRPDDDLFDSVSLTDAYDVTSPTLIDDRANPPVITLVGHPLLDAWVYSDGHTVSRLILIKQFAQS